MSKEREDRLQLVEYELRLAKEDLAAMQKRLEQVWRPEARALRRHLMAREA